MVVSERTIKSLWVTPIEASVDDVPLHGAAVVGVTEDSSTASWEAGRRQAALVTGYLQRGSLTWQGAPECAVFLRLPKGMTVECRATVEEVSEPALGAGWTRVSATIAAGDALRVANVLRRAGI